jgi:hypothetical protein
VSFFSRLNFRHDDFYRRYPDSLAVPLDSDRIPLTYVLGQRLSSGFFHSHLSFYLQRKIANIFSYFPFLLFHYLELFAIIENSSREKGNPGAT